MDYGPISDYKMINYVHAMFDDWPAELIRYRDHVRPEFKTIITNDMTRDAKQRPSVKKYFIDGVKVMEKYWTFNLDDDGFIEDKKVEVAFVKSDGTIGDKFTLSFKTYDLSVPDDLDEVMQERASSRKFVISTLKGQLMYLLKVLHPNEADQVTAWGASFFNKHNSALGSYYEADNSIFIAAVSADTEHTWLDAVAQPGVTLRSMVIGAVM